MTHVLVTLSAALVVSACALGGVTSNDHLFEDGPGRVVLSLQNLSCASCGGKVVAAVEDVPGVTEVAFDRRRIELGVAYEPDRTTPEKILEASQTSGETIVIGSGLGNYAPSVEHPNQLDAVVISRGEEVDIAAHLVPGKVTVIDFYADWCGPCRRVAIVMNAIMNERDDVALRKIDVVEWDTPVAKQHIQGISQLPYTIIFSKTGKEIRRIVGLDIPALHAAIEEGAQ